MLYFVYDKQGLAKVTSDFREANESVRKDTLVLNRNDIDSISQADTIAKQATDKTGELHLAIDNGGGRSPRYDVIRAPALGDKISYGFNGDYYPDGEIVKISDSYRRIESSTGSVYWRRKQTATWLRHKTWSMIAGHVNERNPHF